jgi:lipoprotein-anchoring transpeptidase ErfK/SrfK
VKDGASKVKVDTLVSVKASEGKLSKVTLAYAYTDKKGKTQKGNVDGALSKDKLSWKATERLEPSGSYKLNIAGKNAADQATTKAASFKTQALSLREQTFPTLYPLKDSKVGVGMPVVLTFDVPVKNKKAIEKNLHVTSSPKQTGTWSWFSDTQVRYRPKSYWKPGTKVTVNADVNSVNAGNGVYGQNSAKTNFTVGRSMIIKVNLRSDVATVYKSGKKVRTIYVSAGKPGWESRSGTKLIMGKEYNKKMTNEMIGAKEDYSLVAQYALRITNSGEFLHSAPWNAGNFGRRNASHGCTGMSTADAGWLYERTLVGDPVVTTGTSKSMELGNGYGDWNESYKQYAKGSAL